MDLYSVMAPTLYPFGLSLSKPGTFFYRAVEGEGRCFDKLSTNGVRVIRNLICHAETPARSIDHVSVQIDRIAGGGDLWLEFHVRPAAQLLLPPSASPVRTDGLWRTTCFEMFAKPSTGDAYYEFNFSPSSQWAAYEFDAYRAGTRSLASHDPEISITPGDHFFLAVEAAYRVPSVTMTIALSAVIEETDGTKSYWALRHPPGPPDFHHPDCFALELPALGRP